MVTAVGVVAVVIVVIVVIIVAVAIFESANGNCRSLFAYTLIKMERQTQHIKRLCPNVFTFDLTFKFDFHC